MKTPLCLLFKLPTLIVALLSLFISGCASMGMSTKPYQELANQYANSTSKYLDVDGLTIHYQEEGSGPPLLLIHGVASSLHTWDGWVAQLKDRYRVIRLDLPGFGLTGPDPAMVDQEITEQYMVEKIQGFMQGLGVQKFFIAGNSLGGYIAWNYAKQYPQNLYKMILLDSAGYPQDMPFWIGFASWPIISWVSPYVMPQYMVNWTIESAYADEDKLTDDVRQRYFDLTLREGNRKSYIEHFKMLRYKAGDEQLGAGVKDVIVPTLLMWGDQDEWIPLEIMERFHADLPYSEYIVYEGVGHVPMEELPIQTARDADNFFMSELKSAQAHPQEDGIKFYDGSTLQYGLDQSLD